MADSDAVSFTTFLPVTFAAEISRIQNRVARRIYLSHEGVGVVPLSNRRRVVCRLNRIDCRKIRGVGVAGDIRIVLRVQSDCIGVVVVSTADVCGIDQRSAGGIYLRDKGIVMSVVAIGSLNRIRGGKVGRRGVSGDVGIAGFVNGDSIAGVVTIATQVTRVAQYRIDSQRRSAIV